jgi:hypothetical protein
MEPNIGIAAEDRKAITHGLSRLLADTYTLYLKTHNFHWNVTGPMFNTAPSASCPRSRRLPTASTPTRWCASW